MTLCIITIVALIVYAGILRARNAYLADTADQLLKRLEDWNKIASELQDLQKRTHDIAAERGARIVELIQKNLTAFAAEQKMRAKLTRAIIGLEFYADYQAPDSGETNFHIEQCGPVLRPVERERGKPSQRMGWLADDILGQINAMDGKSKRCPECGSEYACGCGEAPEGSQPQ